MKAYIEDIRRLAEIIKDDWILCGLFEGCGVACEAETMVAQTIHAARINFEKHGKSFSFRGDGVFCSSGGGLVNNGKAYRMLLEKEFFVEGEYDDRPVIFPTQKLITFLDGFFANKG